MPGLTPKVSREHLRSEARSAHAEQDDVGELCFRMSSAKALEVANSPLLLVDDVEPAKPLRFVGSRSRGRHRQPTAGAPCRRAATPRAQPVTDFSKSAGSL